MSALVFELSMPSNNSWNGRWSDEGKTFAIVRPIRSTKSHGAKCALIAAASPYSYNFGDGWRASVSARVMDSREAAKIRRASKGFCGYDWMVDSIYRDGEILSDPRPKTVASASQAAQP